MSQVLWKCDDLIFPPTFALFFFLSPFCQCVFKPDKEKISLFWMLPEKISDFPLFNVIITIKFNIFARRGEEASSSGTGALLDFFFCFTSSCARQFFWSRSLPLVACSGVIVRCLFTLPLRLSLFFAHYATAFLLPCFICRSLKYFFSKLLSFDPDELNSRFSSPAANVDFSFAASHRYVCHFHHHCFHPSRPAFVVGMCLAAGSGEGCFCVFRFSFRFRFRFSVLFFFFQVMFLILSR